MSNAVFSGPSSMPVAGLSPRPGDYVRVTLVMTVAAADVAEADHRPRGHSPSASSVGGDW